MKKRAIKERRLIQEQRDLVNLGLESTASTFEERMRDLKGRNEGGPSSYDEFGMSSKPLSSVQSVPSEFQQKPSFKEKMERLKQKKAPVSTPTPTTTPTGPALTSPSQIIEAFKDMVVGLKSPGAQYNLLKKVNIMPEAIFAMTRNYCLMLSPEKQKELVGYLLTPDPEEETKEDEPASEPTEGTGMGPGEHITPSSLDFI